MGDTDVKVRCSAWAREVELSPIATVGSYRGYLLVESSLPWPKDVGEIRALAGLTSRLGPANIRLQGLVPSSADVGPTEHRVILHLQAPTTSGFSGYHRLETQVGPSLDGAVDQLLAAAEDRTVTGPSEPVADLLVCTHGRRDVCCGSRGTDLALQLAAAGLQADVRLARTSHTGGHRFAPTFLLLPQGTAWAFADAELVGHVLERSVPFAAVAARYRGCAGLPGPQAQAVEREVLAVVGWELLDRERTGFTTGETTSDGGQITRLEAGSDRWEAVVHPGRTLPVPDCMKPLSEAKKSETEWTVSGLRAVA